MADPVPDMGCRADVDAWLGRCEQFGVKLGLDAITGLLHALGDPHTQFPSIHVAGTNGKGSTTALVHGILGATGLAMGRYTSPHLDDFSERIAVGGRAIDEAALVAVANRVARAGGDIPSSTATGPTYFEAATAMALCHFADRRVDGAVLETGLGGRLDATNVVVPRVTVITPVSMDHGEHLGSTVAAVAAEKAGILKPGVPCVTAASGDALAVIRERAGAVGCDLYVYGEDFHLVGRGARFGYAGIRTGYSGLSLGLVGAHQRVNAALAIAAAELWYPKGVALPPHAVVTALAHVRWPGRLERVRETPPVVLDGAHNPAATAALADYVATAPHPGPLWLVLGVLADRPLADLLGPLIPRVAHWVVTAPDTPRAADPADHGRVLRHMLDRGEKSTESTARAESADPGPGGHATLTVRASVADALAHAVAGAERDGGWVCVAGSLYTVAEARRAAAGLR